MLNRKLFEDQGEPDDENALLEQLLQSNHQYNKEELESSFHSKSTNTAMISEVNSSSKQAVSSAPIECTSEAASVISNVSSRSTFQENQFDILGGDSQEFPIPKSSPEKLTYSPPSNSYYPHSRQQHESDFSPNYQYDGNNYFESPRNLLFSSTYSSTSSSLPPPPSTDNPTNESKQDLDILIRIFGEPYSNQLYFWIQILPSAILLGLIIGSGSLLFLFAYKSLFFTWAYPNKTFDESSDDDANPLLVNGEWWWLYVTTGGQFLASLVLLFPNAPNIGEAKTFFHDAVSLQGHVQQTPYVIISSFLSLCSGASIGPEMVLGAYGTGLATYLGTTRSQQLYQEQQQRNLGQMNTRSCFQRFMKCLTFPLTIFHFRPRIQMGLVLAGMGAALGSVFPSPVLAVLIVLELSIAARPKDLRLDAAVEAEYERQVIQQRSREDPTGSHRFHPRFKHPQRPPTAGNGVIREKGHDYMEQLTLVGFAATFAFLAFQGLESFFMKVSHNPNTEVQHAVSFTNAQKDPASPWNILLVIPLGIFCGGLGAGYLLLNGIFRKTRDKISLIFQRLGLPNAVANVFIPTLCGLLYGLITIAYPLTLGSGTLILPNLIEVGFKMEGGSYHDITPRQFLISGLMKLLSSALCLGFGGLVGGQMFPLVFAGACIGISVPHYVPYLPAHITIPCCMASITGSFVPIPLTISAFAMMRMGNDMDMGANVLIAVLVAYTCNGGLGLIQRGKNTLRLGEDATKQNQQQIDLNQYLRMDYDANEMVVDGQSKDMVQKVSSIIFV